MPKVGRTLLMMPPALVLVSGCVITSDPDAPTPNLLPRAEAAPVPVAARTRGPRSPTGRGFDGEYPFSMSLTRIAGREPCAQPPELRRAVVRDGRVSLPYGARQDVVLTGAVGPDGTVGAEGREAAGPVRLDGRVSEDGFSGDVTSAHCVYRLTPFRPR